VDQVFWLEPLYYIEFMINILTNMTEYAYRLVLQFLISFRCKAFKSSACQNIAQRAPLFNVLISGVYTDRQTKGHDYIDLAVDVD